MAKRIARFASRTARATRLSVLDAPVRYPACQPNGGTAMRKGIIAACALALAGTAGAHGGGLDKHGCHHDRKNGGYHCHRGGGATSASPRSDLAASPSALNLAPASGGGFRNCADARAAGAIWIATAMAWGVSSPATPLRLSCSDRDGVVLAAFHPRQQIAQRFGADQPAMVVHHRVAVGAERHEVLGGIHLADPARVRQRTAMVHVDVTLSVRAIGPAEIEVAHEADGAVSLDAQRPRLRVSLHAAGTDIETPTFEQLRSVAALTERAAGQRPHVVLAFGDLRADVLP